MKLPRDTGGEELIKLLSRFGYEQTRQAGSHVRLTSSHKGREHHMHKPLRVGTLNRIIKDVAAYLEMDTSQVIEDLFK